MNTPPHDPAGINHTELDAGLDDGTLTHREVMEREFAELTAPLDAVVAFLLDRARVRPGFAEFVSRFDPLILSSSFHETIEPVLAREGVTARVRANRVDPQPGGWRIRWVSDSDCAACGEPCKRGSLPDDKSMQVFWSLQIERGEAKEPWPSERILDDRFIRSFADWAP